MTLDLSSDRTLSPNPHPGKAGSPSSKVIFEELVIAGSIPRSSNAFPCRTEIDVVDGLASTMIFVTLRDLCNSANVPDPMAPVVPVIKTVCP